MAPPGYLGQPEWVKRFHWADYLVFGMFLVISAAVGVFHGYRQRKGQDAKALLTGGGGMHYVPVALSMMASFLSAIFVLSIPAEIYFHGATYSYLVISYFVGWGTAATVFMPVFHRLGLTSGYQYLEMRFNRTVRVIGSLTFASMIILYMSVVLYTPSLALAHVSGMQLWLSILIVGAVVTLYTSLGGMKATVWNDAFQMMVIFVGFTLMIVLGSMAKQVGGLSRAWNEAMKGERLYNIKEFNPDPSVRTTFWTQTIGGTAKNLTLYASSQAVIQKFLSTKSIADGRKAVWLSAVTTTLLMIMVVLIGSIMYTYYMDCDPLLSGQIEKLDQLMPLFIMDLLGDFHGLPGLLMAAVFSASLSTISGGVNALAAVFLEDIIKPIYNKFRPPMSGKGQTILTRCLAIFFGLVTIVLAFCAESMGKLVLQIVNSMFGCVGGPLTGVFILGMFFPFVNNWGALAGMVISLVLSVWIGVGGVVHKVPLPNLPLSIDQCFNNFSIIHANSSWATEGEWINATIALNDPHKDESHDFLAIYGLSYMYYALFAVIVCVGIGIPVSLITGGNKEAEEMDERLFVFFCEKNCLRPKSMRKDSPNKIYRPKSNSMEMNGKVQEEGNPMIKVEVNDEKKKSPDKDEAQPMIKPGNPKDPKAPLASSSEFVEV